MEIFLNASSLNKENNQIMLVPHLPSLNACQNTLNQQHFYTCLIKANMSCCISEEFFSCEEYFFI